LIDPPVTFIVGISESAARDLPSNAEVVEFLALGSETYLDISQALSVGELRKCHAEELIPAGEVSNPMITTIALYALAKLLNRDELDQLRKDKFTVIHCEAPSWIVN
jgi:hypothetical protein